MNPRERFQAIAHFEKPDKVPVSGGPRKATLERWYTEGLPRDVDLNAYFGFEHGEGISSYPAEGFEWHVQTMQAVNLGPIPPFEYKVLEENNRYRVWVDGSGIKQRGFRSDWEDGWSGFATRQFLEFPVKTRGDFLEMKERYKVDIEARYPREWHEQVERWMRRDFTLGVSIRGPFWWTRDMMGLHHMLTCLYREPELVREIMAFSADFQVAALHKALDEVTVDYAMISEDMAYKRGPMISPQAMREFMLNPYKLITGTLREHGVDVIVVDSDGNSRALIPVWLEAGINGVSPCECAADMDVVTLRKEYPRLILMGGIDKRALTKDKAAIEREVLSKVPYLIETGGYFPGVDHGVPPDISLENFKHYLSFTRKLCGWTYE